EHVVPVLSLHHVVALLAQAHDWPLNDLTSVPDHDAVGTYFGDVAFLEIDEAVRHLTEGGRIGRDEVLADADADDQGAAAARHHDAVGAVAVDHGERVGAFEHVDHVEYGGAKIALGAQAFSMDQMRRHFGVG